MKSKIPTSLRNSNSQAKSQIKSQVKSQTKTQAKSQANTQLSTRASSPLSSTLKELESALNKWDEISSEPVEAKLTEPKSTRTSRDSELISETKKLLARLKNQLADLT
jgi:hypothetical protein